MTASPSALESQKLEKFYQVNIGGDEKDLHVYVSMEGVNMQTKTSSIAKVLHRGSQIRPFGIRTQLKSGLYEGWISNGPYVLCSQISDGPKYSKTDLEIKSKTKNFNFPNLYIQKFEYFVSNHSKSVIFGQNEK